MCIVPFEIGSGEFRKADKPGFSVYRIPNEVKQKAARLSTGLLSESKINYLT
jgi:hypothetical protein